MYFSDLWIGYLGEQIIRQTVQMSKIRCPGCESKLKSPLLHQHEHHSLLEKLHLYFEEIRGALLPTIPELYQQIQHKLPHSDDLIIDQESYISNGRQYMLTITSDALYYGRYINEFLDDIIDEGFKVIRKRKTPPSSKKKLVVTRNKLAD